MSNTTIIVICTFVPLLLSGFLNYYAHKHWILYFPLAGILLAIGYFGYLAIQSRESKPTREPPTDRPWLDVDVSAAGDISFGADGSATFPTDIIVTNSGKMPTNKVSISAEVICPTIADNLFTAPIKRRGEICQEAIKHPGPWDFGTIFPGRYSEMLMAFTVDAKTISVQFESLGTSDKHFGPSLVGCVTYTFGSDDHQFLGQTGFVYEILRSIPNKPGTRYMQIGDNVPKGEVVIRKPVINGDFAK